MKMKVRVCFTMLCIMFGIFVYENVAIVSADEIPITVEDFECIYQMPELPTGCEITAMTMVLNYYGCDVSKVEMAQDYLPTIYDYQDSMIRGRHRREAYACGSDLENYFLGDPFTEYGTVCGTSAIVMAANLYLIEEQSELWAIDLSGITADELYEIVLSGKPAVVFTTIGMEERAETMGWYTEDGTYVEWSHNDHATVIIGCSEDEVVIADPLEGIVTYGKEQFEDVFAQRGYRCVTVEV